MIKLKDLLNETIACGECLQYAYTYAVMNQEKKNIKIVYGTGQNKLVSNNKRYNHAWVEDGNKIKDWQTNDPKGPRTSKYAMKGWPKSVFHKFWNPKNEKKYTPKEVIENFRRTRSIMGWDWK